MFGDWRPTLVNPSRWFVYSGMVPGLVASHYELEACRVDLAASCAAAGVHFIEDRICDLVEDATVAVLQSGRQLGCALLSLDVGSVPDDESIPGAHEHALGVRPLAGLIDGWRAWVQQCVAGADGSPSRIVVVGGGAGGVELTLAMAHALRMSAATRSTTVTLVTAQLVTSHGGGVQRRLERALREAGVRLLADREVLRVEPRTVVCAEGDVLDADLVVCATGARGPDWIRRSPLQTDALDCVQVGPTLQSTSHSHVFASGDVASLLPEGVPKAGVFAVREGPILAHNLVAAATGRALKTYTPQRRWLSLISLGERRAIGSYGPLVWEGGWVWRWKDVIDRRFVAGG